MTEPTKTVVSREVEAYAELDPALCVFTPDSLGLDEEMTLSEWVAESGDDVYEAAKDLDLLLNPTIHLSLREHYDDGTSKVIERYEWKDEA